MGQQEKGTECCKGDRQQGGQPAPSSLRNHLTQGSNRSKTCWWFTVCSIVIATLLHTGSVTYDYFQYEYHEVLKQNSDAGRTFPQIAFCDNAMLSDYAVSRHPEFMQDLREFYSKAIAMVEKVKANYSSSEYDDYIFVISAAQDLIQSSYLLYPNIDPNKTTLYGSQFHSLVVSCSFYGIPCTEEHFELFTDSLVYNCFVFKAETFEGIDYDLNPWGGLALILRAESSLSHRYYAITSTENTKGIRVAVNAPGAFPVGFGDEHFLISGRSTSIYVSQHDHSRLGEPYSQCTNNATMTRRNHTYTVGPRQCLMNCLRRQIFKKCQCMTMFGSEGSDQFDKYCLYLGNNSVVDTKKIICDIKISQINYPCSKCPWKCKETKYEVSLSQSVWPEPSDVENFIEKFVLGQLEDHPVREYYQYLLDTVIFKTNNGSQDANNPRITLMDINKVIVDNHTILEDDDLWNTPLSLHIPDSLMQAQSVKELQQRWVEQYFYRLNIYFSEPYITEHTQVPTLSPADLGSSVGGVMGLWIGISLLTAVELFSELCSKISKWKSNSISSKTASEEKH